MLIDSVIAAYPDGSSIMASSTTNVAIILPYARGLIISGIVFINFDSNTLGCFGVTTIQGKTSDFNGGFTYYTEALTFINSPNKVLRPPWILYTSTI